MSLHVDNLIIPVVLIHNAAYLCSLSLSVLRPWAVFVVFFSPSSFTVENTGKEREGID